jgi:predicted dehydrogenase
VLNKEIYPRRRFLVVGCGSIGQRHIKNLIALGADHVIAFDSRSARREEVAANLEVVTVDALEAAWAMRPEVCVIAAPSSLHIPLAWEAARRGCHLFIEKPLSHTWDGVQDLLDCVQEHGLTTLVGCNLRFHPGLRVVRKFLTDRTIGRIIAARVEVGQYLPDWHPEEDYRQGYSARRELGGGIILDAIHEIDYSRWLLGEVTSAVCMADKLSQLEIDTEDTAALLLRFASGAVGEIHLDYIQRSYSRTCQIIGEEGTIHWDYAAGQVRHYSAQSKSWEVHSNPDNWQPNQMYLDEMRHFLACLAGEEQPELNVNEAAKVLRIALAAKESSQRQTWIELRS